jgi:hypothetical protein
VGWQGRHVLGGDVLAIPKNNPRPRLAARLLELLIKKNIQRARAGRLRWIPVRDEVFDAFPRELLPAIRPALEDVVVRPIGGPLEWKGDDGMEVTRNGLLDRLARYTKIINITIINYINLMSIPGI